MRLIGTVVNWLLGLKPIYRFTRKTRPDRLLELRVAGFGILDDLDTPTGQGLRVRVDTAKGANEFWHMRPRMFDAVSEVHGEAEATKRLKHLDTLLRVHHDRRSQFAATGTPAPSERGGPPERRRRASDDPRFLDTR
jgi:hypothetical protein